MKIFGRKILDWNRINDVAPADRMEKILGAISLGIKKLSESPVPLVGAKIGGADSNLIGASPIVMTMSDTIKQPDRGYELLFDEVNMRQSSNDSFDLLDVSGGVTFYQQLPGEEAKLSKLPTAAKTAVSFLRFTGGFAILDDWLRFNQYYKIDELTSDTVRRWFDKKATLFYGLISALADIDQAFATDDSTTINNACANILTNLQAAGHTVDENSQFVIVCNPLLKARVMKALSAGFLNANSNLNQVVFNVTAIVTTTKMASTHYWVCLPGGKSKRGEWEDLTTRPAQRNELVLGADHVWTGSYNGAIAEKLQFKKCALS